MINISVFLPGYTFVDHAMQKLKENTRKKKRKKCYILNWDWHEWLLKYF